MTTYTEIGTRQKQKSLTVWSHKKPLLANNRNWFLSSVMYFGLRQPTVVKVVCYVTKGRWNDCCLKVIKLKHLTNKYKKRSIKCDFTLKFSFIFVTVRGWIRWDCLWLHYQCLNRSHRASIHWAREDGITLSCCSSLSFSSAATEGSCSAEVEVGTMTVLGLFPASRSW